MAMISDDILKEATARLVERFHPERIILFGSQARGTADRDSDVDLLVIGRYEGNRHDLATEMSRVLGELPFPRDIIVMTPEEFERDRRIPGMVARPAAREGQTLYGQPPGRTTDPMSSFDPDILRAVREWLTYADEDLQVATDLLGSPRRPYRHVANSAQQAAEKYLKAYLVFRLVDFPKTHEMKLLLDLCSQHATWADALREAEVLTRFAVTPRYPGIGRVVTEAEATRAVELAARVQAAVLAALRAEGMELPE